MSRQSILVTLSFVMIAGFADGQTASACPAQHTVGKAPVMHPARDGRNARVAPSADERAPRATISAA